MIHQQHGAHSFGCHLSLVQVQQVGPNGAVIRVPPWSSGRSSSRHCSWAQTEGHSTPLALLEHSQSKLIVHARIMANECEFCGLSTHNNSNKSKSCCSFLVVLAPTWLTRTVSTFCFYSLGLLSVQSSSLWPWYRFVRSPLCQDKGEGQDNSMMDGRPVLNSAGQWMFEQQHWSINWLLVSMR